MSAAALACLCALSQKLRSLNGCCRTATKQAFADKMQESIDTLDLEGNGLGHIDLFAFHGINSEKKLKQVLEGGCLEVIRDLQKQGIIKHCGFSTHGMEPLISKACSTGEFDYINLHHQFIGSFTASGTGETGGTYPSIEAARAQDMGVFISEYRSFPFFSPRNHL